MHLRRHPYLTIFQNRMLDSVPMSCWRKFLIVLLLVLSLPVQSFAAVSMKCESSHFMGEGMSARHEHWGPMTQHHDHAGMMAGGDCGRDSAYAVTP